jgi:HAD domain in Swiss Army Knife RNA repair proteins
LKPLLLVDVDGVISLFASGDDCVPALVEGIPHMLSRRAAAQLNRLAQHFECVWCTGWEDRADTHLPHHLGLPAGWPHIAFTAPPQGAHWKLAGIDAYAGPDRALAWIDDDHDDRTRAWAEQRPGETLLIQTDPLVGLTEPQAERLERWAAAMP